MSFIIFIHIKIEVHANLTLHIYQLSKECINKIEYAPKLKSFNLLNLIALIYLY